MVTSAKTSREELVDRIMGHSENMRRACGMEPTVLYVSKEVYDQIQAIPDTARTSGTRRYFLGMEIKLREGMTDFLAMPYRPTLY